MGVQGLCTLLENHRDVYRDVQFRQSRLVIDGCNLIYLLYFDAGLDQNHGGEYAAFEALIEKFVKALRDCRITPYVVLDGGSDYTDKKLETVTERAKDRIIRAHQAAIEGSHEGILPQLVKVVFKQTLARLEVPVAKCYGEADQEIAALASEWRCPVLSKDSDFYIFDLPRPVGLLPLSDFQWEAVQGSGSQSYIPCKGYTTTSFCIFFQIQPQILPAFAALAGNDYVKLQRRESPIKWAQFAAGSWKSSRLQGLLRWLRRFNEPRDAFEAALGLMGGLSEDKKKELMQDLHLGMEEYKIPPSALKKFFIHGMVPPFPAVEKVAGRVPNWVRLPLTQAQLTSDILDVLLLRRNSLHNPVEHADMPSSQLTSRPLRQLMYGLLLGEGEEVMERDRNGLQIDFIPVKAVVPGTCQHLKLNSLDQAEPSLCLQVLLEALGVTEASLSNLPPLLRLPVAATCYWLRHAQPRPDETLLKALLLGLSTGDALRQRAALQIPNQQHRQKLDLGVVHAINQWMSCLRVSIQLNQLLGFPLPEPPIARLFQGTLIHQLVHRMRSGAKVKPFPKKERSSARLYHTMQTVVHQFHTEEASAALEGHQQASAVAVVAAAPRRQPLDELTTNLQQLFLLYGDGDEEAATEACSTVKGQEDLYLSELVSVKTRYRAKERNNRCRNPELARKEECRGWDLL
ncbi:protein asteroid homolog 1-like isoform X1 [Sander lucioperca]|uniref:protein asteroid homolog 1-like isoform X1 n=1 Tax=Sander lucioperca TaxID=283035 RepID=UPI00125E60DA|nr:protein asteroid homolog 1-like isoform X1 [Sander lucioperca]